MTEPAVVDLDKLDSGLRAWVESLATSGPVLIRRNGQTIGTITYSCAVLEGTIVATPAADQATKPSDLREGTKVLATTMPLSHSARDLLRQSFGPDWVVLDFHDAPDTADVVLTCAHSPQLTHRWTLLFPHAQIIVTEILDPQFGLDIAGPVGRLLDAGAHAYLPPRPLEQVAESVQMYLAGRANGALGSSPSTAHQLNS
jgi:hypothetical protein